MVFTSRITKPMGSVTGFFRAAIPIALWKQADQPAANCCSEVAPVP